MAAQSRLSDMWSGICCCHSDPTCISMTGTIITGSPNHFSGGLSVARLGDMVIGACGHPGTIVTSSAGSFTNGLGKARVGDQVVGCAIGNIITGNPTHETGDAGGGVTVNIEDVPYTEVDFGNVDDEIEIDDGLNIYPPVVGRDPTPEEIQRSEELDVSPTTVVEDSTATVVTETPEITCLTSPIPTPANFVLTPHFTLGRLSSQAVLSKKAVVAQHGLAYNEIICNLQAWAEEIGEPLVAIYGDIITVTSGFRTGSSTSQHERGQAADIQFLTYTNEQVYNVAKYIRDNLNYDQLILEYGGNKPWIHSSFKRSGNRSDTAFNKFGTRTKAGTYQWGTLIYMT